LAASTGILLLSTVVGSAVWAVFMDRERARAEANFRQARAAVDEYFITVSESRLLNVPGMQPLHKELLELARKYYQSFLQDHSADPNVRAEAAASLFRVAYVTALVAMADDAELLYHQAIEQYDVLVRDHLDNATYRSELAYRHGSLGLLLDGLERDDEEMGEFRKAIELQSKLADQNAENAQFQLDLARSYRHVGDLHRQVGEFGRAEEHWKKARSIQEAILRNPPPKGLGPHHLTRRGDAEAVEREGLIDIQRQVNSAGTRSRNANRRQCRRNGSTRLGGSHRLAQFLALLLTK
jgi:tetratricopeptide (TPR) repeat protein